MEAGAAGNTDEQVSLSHEAHITELKANLEKSEAQVKFLSEELRQHQLEKKSLQEELEKAKEKIESLTKELQGSKQPGSEPDKPAEESLRGKPVTAANAKPGLKVRRGKDWDMNASWGDSDGGAHGVGYLMRPYDSSNTWWYVRWDLAWKEGCYSTGDGGKHHLEYA